jgi:enoyl-CoA hydratase
VKKSFCSQTDISEFANFSVEQGAQLAAKGQEILFNFLLRLKTQ